MAVLSKLMSSSAQEGSDFYEKAGRVATEVMTSKHEGTRIDDLKQWSEENEAMHEGLLKHSTVCDSARDTLCSSNPGDANPRFLSTRNRTGLFYNTHPRGRQPTPHFHPSFAKALKKSIWVHLCAGQQKCATDDSTEQTAFCLSLWSLLHATPSPHSFRESNVCSASLWRAHFHAPVMGQILTGLG